MHRQDFRSNETQFPNVSWQECHKWHIFHGTPCVIIKILFGQYKKIESAVTQIDCEIFIFEFFHCRNLVTRTKNKRSTPRKRMILMGRLYDSNIAQIDTKRKNLWRIHRFEFKNRQSKQAQTSIQYLGIRLVWSDLNSCRY